jgi:nitrate reductase assembly molybdenum cofactor insertion protein NarJ
MQAFDSLAAVLSHPTRAYHRNVERCIDRLAARHPQAATLVNRFATRVRVLSGTELESLYSRTFDQRRVCSLEVGRHVFGDGPERGEFLERMRGALRRLGLAESSNLPDHLTHVLMVLGRLDAGEAPSFATALVLPALEEMLEGLEASGNPYQDVLRAAMLLIYPAAAPVSAR